MKSYIFSVVVEEDKFEDGRDAYHACCPALRGCHTWGATYEEALANIQETIELYVEDLLDATNAIPLNPNNGVIERDTPSVVVNL